jgi:hypothetical protein
VNPRSGLKIQSYTECIAQAASACRGHVNRAAVALAREPAEFEATPPNLGADETGDV